MKDIVTVFDFIFGCHHNNLSRVFTIGGCSYRVCCDCGATFDYSLDTMEIKRRTFARVPASHAAQFNSHH